MAMRGDDVIGLLRNPATGRLRFLKTEAKSRATLGGGVVTEARVGLEKERWGYPQLTHLSSYLPG